MIDCFVSNLSFLFFFFFPDKKQFSFLQVPVTFSAHNHKCLFNVMLVCGIVFFLLVGGVPLLIKVLIEFKFSKWL